MFTYLILAIAQLSIAQDGLRDLLPFQGTTATFFSNTSSLDLASPLQLFRRQLQCEDPGYGSSNFPCGHKHSQIGLIDDLLNQSLVRMACTAVCLPMIAIRSWICAVLRAA